MDERKHAAHICLTLPAIYVTMEVEWMERAEKNKMTKYEVLKKYFGYDSFREGQEMLVDALLNGQDVLGIMRPEQENRCVIRFRRFCCQELPWWYHR